VVLAALLAGCGFLDSPRLAVTIHNGTGAPALVQMVEFDPATGGFGAALGDLVTIPAGKSARLRVRIPATEPWALRINDLPGVTSMGWADDGRTLTGEGPLIYSISVEEGGLSTSASRGDTLGGETSAP
jgi:hypothetical protein